MISLIFLTALRIYVHRFTPWFIKDSSSERAIPQWPPQAWSFIKTASPINRGQKTKQVIVCTWSKVKKHIQMPGNTFVGSQRSFLQLGDTIAHRQRSFPNIRNLFAPRRNSFWTVRSLLVWKRKRFQTEGNPFASEQSSFPILRTPIARQQLYFPILRSHLARSQRHFQTLGCLTETSGSYFLAGDAKRHEIWNNPLAILY